MAYRRFGRGTAVLLVAYIFREETGDEIIRIISARKASPQERKIYDQGIQEN